LIKPKEWLNHYDFGHTLGNNGFLPKKYLLPAHGAKTAYLCRKREPEKRIMNIPYNQTEAL
jgi:hypothetical protein